jgi:hypothetical protein
MKTLCILVMSALLLAPSSGLGGTVTVGPADTLAFYWYGSADTIRMSPGTYAVDETSGYWPLRLDNGSPALIGIGGPEAVVVLGSGVERAFYLPESTYDAHIQFEQLTFRGLAQIILHADPIAGDGGEIHFTDNIVEDCGVGPLYPPLQATSCSGLIARNTFRNNRGPAIVIEHTSAAIEDNEIYGNGDGIVDWCCTSPPMRRNHIHDNLRSGIATGYGEGGVIEDNVIERNGGTGLAVGCIFTVQRNVIRGNARGVSSTSWVGSCAAIHYNDIYDNTECNLRVSYELDRTLDCTMNWWGSVDPMVIAEGIQDCYDDPELHVCVVFEPFCMVQGCEAVPVEPSTWGSIKALFRR